MSPGVLTKSAAFVFCCCFFSLQEADVLATNGGLCGQHVFGNDSAG